MLEIRHLTRKYISRVAVNDVSLTIEPGRTYVLLGPNGSGKTTLMKMIAGLTRPTSGEIRYNGMAVGPATKAAIAYMPTESYFYNYMTIRDAGRYYADFFADFSRERYDEILRRMDLNPQDHIAALSSGMNAKVRLALTLSRDAKLMMFDEPLNGVDILTRAQVISEIIRYRDEGRSMIISTHLVDELEEFVDEVIFMKNGEIARVGSRDELRQEGSLTEMYLRLYGGFDGDDPVMKAVSARIAQRMEEEARQRRAAMSAAPRKEDAQDG